MPLPNCFMRMRNPQHPESYTIDNPHALTGVCVQGWNDHSFISWAIPLQVRWFVVVWLQFRQRHQHAGHCIGSRNPQDGFREKQYDTVFLVYTLRWDCRYLPFQSVTIWFSVVTEPRRTGCLCIYQIPADTLRVIHTPAAKLQLWTIHCISYDYWFFNSAIVHLTGNVIPMPKPISSHRCNSDS